MNKTKWYYSRSNPPCISDGKKEYCFITKQNFKDINGELLLGMNKLLDYLNKMVTNYNKLKNENEKLKIENKKLQSELKKNLEKKNITDI